MTKASLASAAALTLIFACSDQDGLTNTNQDSGSTQSVTTTAVTSSGSAGTGGTSSGGTSGGTSSGGTRGTGTGTGTGTTTTGGASTGSTTGTLVPLDLPAGCNPLLGGYDCFLPYPTDFFRVADAGSPTGYWIQTVGAAKLTAALGANADVTDYRPLDGYSHLPAVTAVLPAAISPAGFVGLFDDPTLSTESSSNVLLLDAKTAHAVPSWVDLDPRATDPTRQAIVLHPLVALDYQSRYVVVIHGVQAADGGVVPIPEGFRRLRDELTAGDPILGPLQSHYDNAIFPVIADAGLARADLQLAWDFTTGDEQQADGDMLAVRQLTLDWLETNTPSVAVTSDAENAASNSWRQVQGFVVGPQFVAGPLPGDQLSRDDAGAVVQNGTAAFTFTANIPTSVRDQFGPGRTVSYGHGFFGSQAEVTYDDTMQIAQALGAMFISIDWLGMSTADGVLLATNAATAPYQSLSVLERVPQAMANFIVLQAALRGPLAQNGLFGPTALQRPASGPGESTNEQDQSNAGLPVFDGVTDNYLGISQGGILGGTLNALSPDFGQVVLNVGGSCFTQMLWRAEPFNDFLTELAISFPDPLDQQKFVATLQPLFDRIDPATYAPYVLQHPLTQSPVRHVLMQNGLGDPEVPNLGSFLLARLIGLPQLVPNDFAVYGLSTTAAPTASVLALWDFGISPESVDAEATPPALNDVHNDLRLQPAVLAQMNEFFAPGALVDNTCADAGLCYGSFDGGGLGFLPDGG